MQFLNYRIYFQFKRIWVKSSDIDIVRNESFVRVCESINLCDIAALGPRSLKHINLKQKPLKDVEEHRQSPYSEE